MSLHPDFGVTAFIFTVGAAAFPVAHLLFLEHW